MLIVTMCLITQADLKIETSLSRRTFSLRSGTGQLIFDLHLYVMALSLFHQLDFYNTLSRNVSFFP